MLFLLSVNVFSRDTYLVENAAWALSQLGCSSQKLQDQMIALLDDPSQNHRILIQSLAGLNVSQAIDSISRFQQDPSPGVKGAAISAAVILSGKASNLDVLAEHLFLPNQMDRQCAVQDIIDAKADSLLPQVLKAPVSPVFRMRALRLLFQADQSENHPGKFLIGLIWSFKMILCSWNLCISMIRIQLLIFLLLSCLIQTSADVTWLHAAPTASRMSFPCSSGGLGA